MKLLRNHITRSVLTLAIILGMGFYLVQPFRAEPEAHTNTFSNWLEGVVDQADGNAVAIRKELLSLKHSGQSLSNILLEASRIISRHQSTLNLPIGKAGEDSQRVYDLLVWEWNSYHTGNGMGKAPSPNTLKPYFKVSVDKSAPAQFHQPTRDANLSVHAGEHASRPVASAGSKTFHTDPLSGGTAIGAP